MDFVPGIFISLLSLFSIFLFLALIKFNSSAILTSNVVLLITALLVALITGLWYAYSCSVNLGLGKLPDSEYLMGMQSINREILNLVFFATFMGTLLLLPVCYLVKLRASQVYLSSGSICNLCHWRFWSDNWG